MSNAPNNLLDTDQGAIPSKFSASSPKAFLTAAWNRQDTYSDNASHCQKRFVLLRTMLVILSVSVILLSVIQPKVQEVYYPDGPVPSENVPSVLVFVNAILLLLPIIITALLAFSVKFDRGNNWLLLRGSAEALKLEIYCYRTRVGAYRHNRDAILSRKIKIISERLRGSAVHQAALDPYEQAPKASLYRLGVVLKLLKWLTKTVRVMFVWVWERLFEIRKQPDQTTPKDDLYSDLNAETYLEYRLYDQFTWYRNKAQLLDKRLQWLETSIYIFGGVGTLLAASINFKSWVAVTTALTGAFSSYLDFKRVEATLVGYNRAADALYDVYAWWLSLSPSQQQQFENFERLVTSAEEIIRSEHVSWLQDMQDRLAELYGLSDSDVDDEFEQTNLDEEILPKP